jgi:hypothetical protein
VTGVVGSVGVVGVVGRLGTSSKDQDNYYRYRHQRYNKSSHLSLSSFLQVFRPGIQKPPFILTLAVGNTSFPHI